MIAVYPALFHPNKDDGSITITFPDLPGCTSEGKDLANALYMARDALAFYLDTLSMLGDKIPAASDPESIARAVGEYVTLIDADPDLYMSIKGHNPLHK